MRPATMGEDTSFHPYPYMDSIKKEKLEAAARFRRLQHLRGAIKVLLFASVCFCLFRFVLSPDLPESLLNTINCYISKRAMFFLCNLIFAFLAADSRMVAGQPSPPPIQREDRLMNSSESEGKELVVSVSLGKEEAGGGDGSIVNRELGDSLVVGAWGEQGAATKWEVVSLPPSEKKELAFEVRKEGRREQNDGSSGNCWSPQKNVLLGNKQSTPSWEGGNPAVGAGRKHSAASTWGVVPVPPSEEKEVTFKVSEEGRRNWNDGPSGNLWSNQKFGLLGKQQRINTWELVPVPPTMAEEVPSEESWDVMEMISKEDINKKCDDFIAKTRRTWRQESMQLVVV